MYSNKQIEFALKNIDKWSEQATQIFKDEIINAIQEDYKGFLETIKVYQTVLKYAREALENAQTAYLNEREMYVDEYEAVVKALDEIDNAIGGGDVDKD